MRHRDKQQIGGAGHAHKTCDQEIQYDYPE